MSRIIERFFPRWARRLLKRSLAVWRLYKVRRRGLYAFEPAQLSGRIKILFFHPSGLNFGGTEKSLQILAKHLPKDRFEVSFVYAPQCSNSRAAYMSDAGVRLVPFQFSASGELPLSGMSPELSRILTDCSPDIVFTAGAGYPEYPMANITKLPIIHYNIFGSINPQTNIVAHWCISQLLTTRVQELLPKRIVETVYIQSEGPDARAVQRGQELRHSLGIPDGDIVFGRIGRPDDNIFDPIGIEAFRRVAVLHPNAHYLIVTPPPCLRKLLQEHPVPRVHLLPEQVSNEMSWSGVEEKVWAFHAAADVLAHFRLDGETMGLNIAESMLSGKPVITHVSRFWNAHLEYLDATCAFVAEQDNVTQYADYMTRFLKPDGSALLQSMGKASLAKAQPLFLVQNNIESISNRIEATLLKTQNSL